MSNSAYRVGPPLQQAPQPKEEEALIKLLAQFIGALFLFIMAVAWYGALAMAGAVVLAQVVVAGLHAEHVTTGLLGPFLLVTAAEGVISGGVMLGIQAAGNKQRKAAKKAAKKAAQ